MPDLLPDNDANISSCVETVDDDYNKVIGVYSHAHVFGSIFLYYYYVY